MKKQLSVLMFSLIACFGPQLALSADAVPTCKAYGCADCSCVASNPDANMRLQSAMPEIKEALLKHGIPPEAAMIYLKGADRAKTKGADVVKPEKCGFCCFEHTEPVVKSAKPEACGICCDF